MVAERRVFGLAKEMLEEDVLPPVAPVALTKTLAGRFEHVSGGLERADDVRALAASIGEKLREFVLDDSGYWSPFVCPGDQAHE